MNGHTANRRALAVRPGGFTMVELLVTVGIIAILATMVMGAMHISREAARETQTRSTIRKLDTVMMEIYDSYRSRRVPLLPRQIAIMAQARGYWDPASEPQPSTSAIAAIRMEALRDIMRLEMPERWADVRDEPAPTPLGYDAAATTTPIARPALAEAYFRRYRDARVNAEDPTVYGPGLFRDQGTERINRYSSAECLYMIVSMAGGADARDKFYDKEIGDADADGLFEFLDGWGNPIFFLRWAPGLTGSPIQAQTFFDPDGDKVFTRDPAIAESVALADHDPFDSRNLHGHTFWLPAYQSHPIFSGRGYAHRLVPYIYSAGRDGIYDVNFEGMYHFTHLFDPYFFSTGPVPNEAGMPGDWRNESVTAMDPPADMADPAFGPKQTPNSLDHFDNIDNHRLEAQ